MRTVSLGGGRQASFEAVGRGDPMLMFPGGPGFPSSIVRDDAELVAGKFTVFLIDPPGTGASTSATDLDDYGHEGHARFYNEVREALDLGRVSVHGVSFGGVCAITFAASFPESTTKCIAVSTYGVNAELDAAEGGSAADDMERMLARHEGAEWYEEARRTLDDFTEIALANDDPAVFKTLGDVILPLYIAHPDRPDVARRLEARRRMPIIPNVAAIKHWESGLYQTMDLRSVAREVRVPVLLVAGELDFIAGPAQANALAREIPNCEVVVVPGCGHVPAAEEPEIYRKVMLDWLLDATRSR